MDGPFHARGELVLKKHSGGLTTEEERLLHCLTKRCRRVFRQQERQQSRGLRKMLRRARAWAAEVADIRASLIERHGAAYLGFTAAEVDAIEARAKEGQT